MPPFILTADLYRPPALVDDQRSLPALWITGLKLTPLDPISASQRVRLGPILHPHLDAPYTLLQTFCQQPLDARPGDELHLNGHIYPIRAVAVWQGRHTTTTHLILEAYTE